MCQAASLHVPVSYPHIIFLWPETSRLYVSLWTGFVAQIMLQSERWWSRQKLIIILWSSQRKQNFKKLWYVDTTGRTVSISLHCEYMDTKEISLSHINHYVITCFYHYLQISCFCAFAYRHSTVTFFYYFFSACHFFSGIILPVFSWGIRLSTHNFLLFPPHSFHAYFSCSFLPLTFSTNFLCISMYSLLFSHVTELPPQKPLIFEHCDVNVINWKHWETRKISAS